MNRSFFLIRSLSLAGRSGVIREGDVEQREAATLDCLRETFTLSLNKKRVSLNGDHAKGLQQQQRCVVAGVGANIESDRKHSA